MNDKVCENGLSMIQGALCLSEYESMLKSGEEWGLTDSRKSNTGSSARFVLLRDTELLMTPTSDSAEEFRGRQAMVKIDSDNCSF